MVKKIGVFVLAVALLLALALGTGYGAGTEAGTPETPEMPVIEAEVSSFAYPNLVVEAGKTVRINFKVQEKNLNYCNYAIIMPEWGIQQELVPGDNWVEITPAKAGEFIYTCWMGMLAGKVTVVEPGTEPMGLAQANAGEASQGLLDNVLTGGMGACGSFPWKNDEAIYVPNGAGGGCCR